MILKNSSLNIHIHVSEKLLPFLSRYMFSEGPLNGNHHKKALWWNIYLKAASHAHGQMCWSFYFSLKICFFFPSYIHFVCHKIKQRMCEEEINYCLIYKDLSVFFLRIVVKFCQFPVGSTRHICFFIVSSVSCVTVLLPWGQKSCYWLIDLQNISSCKICLLRCFLNRSNLNSLVKQ